MFLNRAFTGICGLLCAAAAMSCGKAAKSPDQPVITSLSEVPSVRLNFRYEADVPPPDNSRRVPNIDRDARVQSDFDRNRPHESLERTIISPDGKRVIAVYYQLGDAQSEFRLDVYSQDGALLRKMTPDSMAVHFPDTIVWSPDSTAVAFVAVTRAMSANPVSDTTNDASKKEGPVLDANDQNSNTSIPDSNAAETAEPTNGQAAVTPQQATPTPPPDILTFRTEQIYMIGANGDGLRPITQNEGLIYFYFVWSPDSSMLAALAATSREWQYLEVKAEEKKEQFVPVGRPRVLERSGRERHLDDALTAVQPVWSPDSAKIACAFDVQVRIYDSRGDAPTQAAIPLVNQLLLSSQAYDREQQLKLESGSNAVGNVNSKSSTQKNTNSNTAANTSSGTSPPALTLPDRSSLVSFNPIVSLEWPTEEQVYFQTAYVKRMKNEADSVMSYSRWHRLILSPQPGLFVR